MKIFIRVCTVLAICLLSLLMSSATLAAAAHAHTFVNQTHPPCPSGKEECITTKYTNSTAPQIRICRLARLLNDTTGFIDVPAAYSCSGAALGHVSLTVNQTAQQSGAGHATTATGTQDVNCDGQPLRVGIPSNPNNNVGFNPGPHGLR